MSACAASRCPCRLVAPADLANEIDATRMAFEGARKLVTVMFSDIVGATRLIDGQDPEIAYQKIDQTLAGDARRFKQYDES